MKAKKPKVKPKIRNYMHLHVRLTTRMQVQEDRTKYNRKKEKDRANKEGIDY